MPSTGLCWREIALPPVVSPEAARATLLGLASLPGQPRLVLEALATTGAVTWRIGGEETVVRKAIRIVQAHLPGTLASGDRRDLDADLLSVATQVRLSHSRQLPLASAHIDQVSRGLLSVFAGTGQGELLRLQLVLGARLRPHRAPEQATAPRRIAAAKHAQHGVGCCLRIGARSVKLGRARQLVSDAAAALRGVESPGVHLWLQSRPLRQIARAGSPLLWPLWLSVEELVPMLGWPIASQPEAQLPAVPPRHPRLMPATAAHSRAGRELAVSSVDLRHGRHRPVAQSIPDSLQHTHVMGLTGTGKSTLLAQLVLSDADAGQGAVVIDPKGDLVDDILARIPENRLDDVVILDPRDPAPVGINPLTGTDPDLAADGLLAVFHSLYRDAWGPRTSDLLHGSLLTLARHGDASLVMVPLLLTNAGFRRSVIGTVVKQDPLGLGSFWATFNSWSDTERDHAIQPLLNKLRQVLLRPTLRGVFGQRQPRFDIRDVFTKQRILLVSLGKGTIGAEAAQLLGSVIVTHLWQATTQRINTAASDRAPVQVYVDELQDYLRLPGDLGDALAQARGLGVGFTLSHQELTQLGSLRPAVLANTRSRVYLQIAPTDARDIASAFGDGVLTREDFRALPAYQAYAQLLSSGSTAPWVSLSTQPLPEPLRTPDSLRQKSAARYGQPLDAVEADLLRLLDHRAGDMDEASHRPTERLGRRRASTSASGDAS